MNAEDCVRYSGAANGAESVFGEMAEKYGIEEVNFSFEEHADARLRGIRVLTHRELEQGDVSLTYVSRLMNRRYKDTPLFKKVLQGIWHQVNNSRQIFVVGKILEDGTVKGGTGWGAEFAKLCNKPLFVFDQDRDGWFYWVGEDWQSESSPAVTHAAFAGTGTRFIQDNGRAAIGDLFARSFK